jgi:tetratricopeptide (TPR) repeat protein
LISNGVGGVMQGRPQDALPEIELVRNGPFRAALYAIAYYALGRKKESDAALSELITKYHASMAYQIAEVYAFRNQPDEAFEWLDRAYAQHDSGLIGTKVEPLLKKLHGDPRFAAFLKKLNQRGSPSLLEGANAITRDFGADVSFRELQLVN